MPEDLPSSRDVANTLLKFLGERSRPVAPRELYAPLADHFGLTPHQLALKRQTTDGSLWHNRVQTSREHLAREGLLERAVRGKWLLTDKGREWARLRDRPFTVERLDD